MFRILLNNINKKPKTLIATTNGGYLQNNNNNKQQQNIFNFNSVFGYDNTNDGSNSSTANNTYINNFNNNNSKSNKNNIKFNNYSTTTTSSSSSPSKKSNNNNNNNKNNNTTYNNNNNKLSTTSISSLPPTNNTSTTSTTSSYGLLFLNNNADIKIIIKQIENEPNKIENYQKLSDLLGSKGRVIIRGKEIGQKEIFLEIINIDSKQLYIHYFLYTWLTEIEGCSKDETITLLDGETTLSLKDLLIKEIENNPNFTIPYLKLTTFQSSMLDDKIIIPLQTSTQASSTNNTFTMVGLNKLELLLKVLDIEPDNKVAIHQLSTFLVVNKFNEIQMMNGELVSTHTILYKNYQLNKTSTPFSSIYLSDSNETTQQQSIKILSDSISIFPFEHRLYLKLADKLVNNFDMVTIASSNGGTTTSLNRLQLLGISISSQEQYLKDNNISNNNIPIGLAEFYFKLGSYLDNRNQIINDISSSGANTSWNNISLFIKALQINPLHLECKKQLIQSLTNKEIILIGNKSYSKLDLLYSMIENSKQIQNTDYYKFIYSSLSNYYKQQQPQQQDQYIKFNNLLKKEIENRKLELIKLIENYPFYSEYYSLLYLEMEKDESVLLGKKMMNKIDILLKAIELNPKREMLHYQLFEELERLNSGDDNVTITLLDGTTQTKQDLLLKESLIKPNYSKTYYSMSKLIGQDDDDEETINNKIQFLSVALSLDTKNYQNYLELGLLMYKHSINSLQLSRKQMFIKSLEQEDPSDPINGGKNLLAWYHLALEMNNDQDGNEELQFGKSKSQILQFILNNNQDNIISLNQIEILKNQLQQPQQQLQQQTI